MIEQLHKLLLNNYKNPSVILQKKVFNISNFPWDFTKVVASLKSLHWFLYMIIFFLNFIVFLLLQFLDSSSPPAYLVFAAKQRVLKQGLRILDVPYVLYETLNKSIVITGKTIFSLFIKTIDYFDYCKR